MGIITIIKKVMVDLNLERNGIGNKKIISKSKTKKIIVIRKKCKEKEIRAFENESKPHSKADIRFRCIFPLWFTIKLTNSNANGTNKNKEKEINLNNINVERSSLYLITSKLSVLSGTTFICGFTLLKIKSFMLQPKLTNIIVI